MITQNPTSARAKMEEIVARSASNVEAVLQKIESEHPVDALVPFNAMRFAEFGNGIGMSFGTEPAAPLHDHALGQMAGRADVPMKFVRDLTGFDWGRALLAHNLNELSAHMEGRSLVRKAGGEYRGILSASYRRLDSRPLAERIVRVANEVGGVPIEARYTDVRTSLRVIRPVVLETIPGRFGVFGLDWRNSDYGSGANELSFFWLELMCVNGATMERVRREIHLGRVMDEDVFSERTYKLDTAATVSAMGDAVRAALLPDASERAVARIKKAAETEVDPDAAVKALGKSVSKAEAESIVKLYRSADIEMMPPGNTTWRWSNAISRFASITAEDGDAGRAIELNALAGSVLPAAA